MSYQNGIIIIQMFNNKNKYYAISNESIIKNNNDIIINENDLYTNNEDTQYIGLLYFLPNNIYDYNKIDRAKIKIACFYEKNNKLVIFNKEKTIFSYILENDVKTDYYVFQNYFLTYRNGFNFIKKVIILDDLITDNYKYEIYDNSK